MLRSRKILHFKGKVCVCVYYVGISHESLGRFSSPSPETRDTHQPGTTIPAVYSIEK